eukprot:scaffold74615_cov72-Cyclotella_meneghiniana.AAC.3
MTSINDLSIDEAYMTITAPACEAMKGGTFRIDHLTSEKGLTLNGKTCRVVDFTADPKKNPDMRLQCQLLEGGGKPILLKGCNLVHVQANVMRTLMEGSAPLSDAKILTGLQQGLAHHNLSSDTRDLNHRVRLYKNLRKKLQGAKTSENANVLDDKDYCFPCGATYTSNRQDFDTTFDYIMNMGRPACVGNNQVDMRLMDVGLKGNGVANCTICSETLDEDTNEQNLVTLPCVHMFHDACLHNWLDSDLGRKNWNCPTCRHPVPHNLSTYRIEIEIKLYQG